MEKLENGEIEIRGCIKGTVIAVCGKEENAKTMLRSVCNSMLVLKKYGEEGLELAYKGKITIENGVAVKV